VLDLENEMHKKLVVFKFYKLTYATVMLLLWNANWNLYNFYVRQ